jgi:hypothetical protein
MQIESEAILRRNIVASIIQSQAAAAMEQARRVQEWNAVVAEARLSEKEDRLAAIQQAVLAQHLERMRRESEMLSDAQVMALELKERELSIALSIQAAENERLARIQDEKPKDKGFVVREKESAQWSLLTKALEMRKRSTKAQVLDEAMAVLAALQEESENLDKEAEDLHNVIVLAPGPVSPSSLKRPRTETTFEVDSQSTKHPCFALSAVPVPVPDGSPSQFTAQCEPTPPMFSLPYSSPPLSVNAFDLMVDDNTSKVSFLNFEKPAYAVNAFDLMEDSAQCDFGTDKYGWASSSSPMEQNEFNGWSLDI